ncbi:glycoside hydrolase family 16 protein [Microbacterium sp. CFBP9034]|uniref:glycoside hydrolase family 16 protein n=1 Tax=Microbacterium sp. CFBP9034 TaxID=3096540 RepID=UPI002A6A857F|nr:family 16 glycosylhydrolase [Microbacterium sp. CFBP9034]MDY0907911.1 family 16 glycosylhydrolase [Microbacterium sp. CFBP9034]
MTSIAASAPAIAATEATAVTATTTATSRTVTHIPTGSAGWRYWRSATAPASTWLTESTPWPNGTAPFGWGRETGPVGTVLPTVSGSQPLSTYFKKTFVVESELPTSVRVTTWADDGVVLYLNDREIGRVNVASSTAITHDRSYAVSAPSSLTARQRPVTIDVPVSALKPGTNRLAAHVLSNWRATPNISFDASLTATYAVAGVADDDSVAGWGTPDWRDEFSYVDPATGKPAVDPTKWNVRERSTLGLLFDAAVVDRQQVTVDSEDTLHIRADWLDTPITRTSGTGPTIWHKTGYLDQRQLRTGDVSRGQQYGRWEIRAKTPTGPNTLGSLAAFWLRNSQSGEIDIMEAWGYDNAAVRDQVIDTATTTVHTHTSNPSLNKKFWWHHSQHGGPTPVWDGFHTYAFELTPAYAAIIVDGKELARTTPAQNPTLWNTEYFGSPLHMRLNLHVGPSALYWGLPDPNNRAATQNLDFQVDYVRTWAYEG